MGERKGQNKYYPPDFDYRKHKSLDAYHGTHPLRERAKKVHLGILTIRFEMPYNIWCDGCGNHIGMGVRYNAEKSKIGNYYTTPIYKFRMKCHLCPNYIEIKTDPAAHDYVIISGARRKEQRWDPKENEQIVTDDKAMQKKLATDPMFRLEHSAEDQAKIKMSKPGIEQLAERREAMKDDYLLNRLARDNFRAEKKMLKAEDDNNKALLTKSSLDIALVDEHSDDVRLAHLMKYRTVASFDEKLKKKREEIEGRSIFAVSSSKSSPISTQQNVDRPLSKVHQLASRLGIEKSRSRLFGNSKPNFGTIIDKAKPGSLSGVKLNVNKKLQVQEDDSKAEDINDESTSTEESCKIDKKYDLNLSNNVLKQTCETETEMTISENSDIDSEKPNALSFLSLEYDSSSNSGDDATK